MMVGGWLEPPMEVIPEEGEAGDVDSARRVSSRRREVFTSEQVDTLVSTVPKNRVPEDWIIEDEEVDPKMASTYLSEALAEEAAARGSAYSYSYESHYDIPPEDAELVSSRSTHKVTRVTKVTTTRSLRQIPVESPYDEVFFDSAGLPVPVASLGDVTGMGIRLSDVDKAAPPPAPPSGPRYSTDGGIPDPPGAPEIVESEDARLTLCWSRPLHQAVLGYQIEMRDYPEGDWERVHDHILREPSCTITNLDSAGRVQFRVSALGRAGFSAPSPSSVPCLLGTKGMPPGTSSLPLAPGRPVVVGVDGSRASLEWTPPPVDPSAPPLLGYQLEYRVYGTTHWIVANDTLTTETRYHVENLRPNGVYEFHVRARNAEGLGAASRCSGPAHIKPAVPLRNSQVRPVGSATIAPPGQPQAVESDLSWVKLEWSMSEEEVEYIVELREVGDPSWYQANHTPLPGNSILVEGLRPGSTYEFRVVATQNGMMSRPSETSEVVSLRPMWKPLERGKGVPSQPEAPEILEVVGGRLTLCWTPAHSALPVIGYDVEFRDFAQDNGWYKVNDDPVTACKMTVGDLIVGHDYEFRIVALNSIGFSEPSPPSAPHTVQPTQNGEGRYIEAERFGAIRLLQDEMVRESPPLPDRDDSPPPMREQTNGQMSWRDPNLREVIEYLGSPDREKQKNASGYLQHLTFSDNVIKDETRELGGIPRLVALLRSDDPVTVKNACGCLKNLSYGKENDTNKLAILEADGVAVLAAVVATSALDDRAKEATAALWNLSSADELKRPVLNAATDPLTHIITSAASSSLHSNGAAADPIRNFQNSLFKNATGVLRNVSAADSSARCRLRDAHGLVDGLLHFLALSIQRNLVDSVAVENVVCLLRNLSYRIQEVEDPHYDPYKAHENGTSRRSKSAPSASPKVSKKNKKDKDKRERETAEDAAGARVGEEREGGGEWESLQGVALLWQPSTVRLYLKLLQEASNLITLEACAGAVQNLAACQWAPSAGVRTAVRVEKGLPVLVELVRLKEDHVVCAVATALRNLALDERNRELIGKYALRDLLDKLPDASSRRQSAGPSDQTIAAVLGILFEIVRSSASSTKDIHEAKGTERLRALAKAYPAYSQRVAKYASQVLYMMWQHKELHDGFKRAGLKEADFYAGPRGKGAESSATLARPISSQGRERPRTRDQLNDTYGSDAYGTFQGDAGQLGTPNSIAYPMYSNGLSAPSYGNNLRYDQVPHEPVYASVRKPARPVDDSWV